MPRKKQQKSCCFKCKLMHATIILSSGGLKAFKIPLLDIKLISLISRTDQLHILHPFWKQLSFGVFSLGFFGLVFNFLKTNFLDFFLSNIFLISLKRNVENGFSIIEHFNLFEMGFLASICSVLPDLNFFWRWVHIWYQKLLIGTLALMVNIEEWVARNQ